MTESPHIGDTMAQYEFVEPIAKGGMSQVFRARDHRLGRDVAVKVLAEDLAGDPSFRDRFEREWRAAAGIRHPNVLPLLDAGEWHARLYIVMPLVDGVDLARVIDEQGPLSVGRTATIVTQVAAALDAAHQLGLIHRDVKPGNILVTAADGPGADHVYLADFGLTTRGNAQSRMTRTGVFLGTVAYVAPEQLLGQPVDPRTDEYSLACVAFEMLTGSAPYASDAELSMITAHLHAPPPMVSAYRAGLPSGLDHVVAQGMAKDPAQRFQTAGGFASALVGALATPVSRGYQPTVIMPVPDAVAAGAPAPGVADGPARRAQGASWPPGTVAPPRVAPPTRTGTGRRTGQAILVGVVAILVVAAGLVFALPRGSGNEGVPDGTSPAVAGSTPAAPAGATNVPAPAPSTGPALVITADDYTPENPDAGAVQVSLVDPDGPVEGWGVGIYESRLDATGQQVTGDRLTDGSTDNTGTWLQELPPGEYIITGDLSGNGWGDLAGGQGQTRVIVEPGRVTRLAVSMGFVIVQLARMDGPLVDHKATIYLQTRDVLDQPALGHRVDEAYTDNTGAVRFRVTPGTYVVTADLPGYNWGDLSSRQGVTGVEVAPLGEPVVRDVLGRIRLDAPEETEVSVHYQETTASGDRVLGDRIDSGYTDNTGSWSIDLTEGDYGVRIGDVETTGVHVTSGQLTEVS